MDIYQVKTIKFIYWDVLILTNLKKLIFASTIAIWGLGVQYKPLWCPAQCCLPSQMTEAAIVALCLVQNLQHILVCSLISEWYNIMEGMWKSVNPDEWGCPFNHSPPPDRSNARTAQEGLLSWSWNNTALINSLSCHEICIHDPGIQGSPSKT